MAIIRVGVQKTTFVTQIAWLKGPVARVPLYSL
jgi:hypothetical protein